ncbi:MAG: elongation factor P [Tissierellia bacterium]|nr:elongation factor P [Tissierellia bacterium]
MISAGDFRKGLTFEMDGDVYQVIDFQHVKPGKGAAFVRAKIKSVMHGTTKELTFNPSDRYEKAVIEEREMQYLYNDGTLYYFMDNESYEQIPIEESIVKEALNFIRENDNAYIHFYQNKPFDVSPPNFVELAVTETEPGIKGDTASGATKSATVETGFSLQVPLFVEMGDIIRIDARSGEYMSRK